MTPMVTRLTDIAWRQQLKIETLQPEPAVTTEQITRFPLRISLHADLAHLVPLLHNIRTATPALQIDKLDIRYEPAKDNLLKVEMTIASFVIVEKQAAGTKKAAKNTMPQDNLPVGTGTQAVEANHKPTRTPAVGLPMVTPTGRTVDRETPRGAVDKPAAEVPRGVTR